MSLGGDRVTSIHEDASGGIWVGAISGGLSRYDPLSDAFQYHSLEEEGAQRRTSVMAVVDGPEGGLWLGTLKQGLLHFEPESGRFATSQAFQPDDGVLVFDCLLDLAAQFDVGHTVFSCIYLRWVPTPTPGRWRIVAAS